MKKVITLLLFVLFVCSSYAQSPGCVTTDLDLWLDAEQDVLEATGPNDPAEDGDNVTDWLDQSSSGYYGAYNNFDARLPNYQTGEINGHPAVEFTRVSDAVGDHLWVWTGGANTWTTDDHYTFVVTKTDMYNAASTDLHVFLGCTYDVGYPYYALIYGSGHYYTNNSQPGGVPPGTVSSVLGGSGSTTATNYIITENKHYSNTLSSTLNGGTFVTGAETYDRTWSHILGSNYNGTFLSHFDGMMAEVIVYTQDLSSANRNSVNTYLNLKYAIDIPASAHDYFTDGSYDNNNAGIGRWDCAGLNQLSSKSVNEGGIVRMTETASFASNLTFLVWGHNGSALESNWADAQLPSGIARKLQRIWRARETTSFTVDQIEFDLTDVPGALTESHLELLIDDDGDFSDATRHTTGRNLTGRTLTFTNVDFDNTSASYFTIGSTNLASPLPIEVVDFDASHEQGVVQLEWVTMSEQESKWFIVERSKDGKKWEEVSRLAGAINSNMTLDYAAVDSDPYHGTSFYRLKKTSQKGEFEFSEVRSVSIEQQSDFKLYPNPTQGAFYLNFEEKIEHLVLNMVDATGRAVYREQAQNGRNFLVQPNEGLASGLYFLYIQADDKQYVEQIRIR